MYVKALKRTNEFPTERFVFISRNGRSFENAVTTESINTSSCHTLALHLQLQADVPLKGDVVLHRSFLQCSEILCRRKCKELEAPLSKSPSQAAQEKPTLQRHAADGGL